MLRHKKWEVAEGKRDTAKREDESQKGLTDDGRRRTEGSPESGHRTPEVAGKWKCGCTGRVIT